MQVKLKSCEIVSVHSEKTGRDYVALQLTFDNGYQKIIFLNSQEQFILGVKATLN